MASLERTLERNHEGSEGTEHAIVRRIAQANRAANTNKALEAEIFLAVWGSTRESCVADAGWQGTQ